MMKWIVTIVVVLIAVPVLLALAGLCVSRTHVAASRAVYSQKPETLWEVLADFEKWPEWNSAMQRMEKQSDREGKPVWLSIGKWGRMPLIIERWEPPRRLETRIPEDAGLGFSGTWSYEIEAVEVGAALTITERGAVSNPIFRLMGAVFFDAHSTLEQTMKALGGKFAETTTPQRVAPASPGA